MREVTEYDGYEIETPYVGKTLSNEEREELERKKEEAREKALDMIKDLL